MHAGRFSARIGTSALQAIRLPATPNAFTNLNLLEQLNLLPQATAYWAHALRRTGNAVRHIQRQVSGDDAELAVLFLERCLGWFFVAYAHGPRLADLSADGLRLLDSADPATRGLPLTLEQGAFDADTLLDSTAPNSSAVHRSPTLPAVASDLLLERSDPEAARRVALASLERFPDDLRPRQLVGLSYSRQKDLEQARRWLEPLLERYHDDDETIGITAGLFKRLAETRDDRAWLTRAHRAYRHGWDCSRHSNAYLGINAASTALFLGQSGLAHELAGGVREVLLLRLARVGGTSANASTVLGYWDSVTLAEAHLLLRDFSAARTSYREAFARQASLHGSVEVTRHQLARLLRLLAGEMEVDHFLETAVFTS